MKRKWILTLVIFFSVSIFSPLKGYAALGDQTLSKGMVHKDIKELQEYLLMKGVYPYHTATGYYGSITEEAVKVFQQEQNIQVDGIAGPQTNNKLKLLKNGDIGKPVIKIQQLLKAWNTYDGAVDGIYGKGTKLAVIKFQKQKGLSQDGIVGPKTFVELSKKAIPASSAVKELTVESTAYTASCKGCSGVTKMGVNLNKYGDGKVIAVDPNIIPMGSTVEIEGYGTALAADIGGGISGHEVDIFFSSENTALNWGRKNVKVRVLD